MGEYFASCLAIMLLSFLSPQLYPFEKVLLPAVYDRVAIGDAQSYQSDVMAHDPRSKSAGEFRALTAEILRRAELIN